MIRQISTLLFALSLACFSASALAQSAKKLPEKFELSGMTGGKFSPKNFKNRLTIIEFWASWCGSCGKVMGELNALAMKQKNVNFISVTVDEDKGAAHEYFKNKKMPANIKALKKKAYFDSEAVLASALDVEALPTYIVVDAKGNILELATGEPEGAQLERLKKVLKTKKSA